MTGAAAANYAGPAVVLSFALAALACTFAAPPHGLLPALFGRVSKRFGTPLSRASCCSAS